MHGLGPSAFLLEECQQTSPRPVTLRNFSLDTGVRENGPSAITPIAAGREFE
jgi:hypothetical protein